MKKLLLIASVAVLALSASTWAEQHEDERGPLTDVWVMVPKKGMEAQFEAAIAADIAFRAAAEDSRTWQGYRAELGHNYGVYQFRACCFDWADQDAYVAEANEKGFDANWNKTVHQYVDHYHHHIDMMDWENSHWPDDSTGGPYYGVTSWTLKQNAGPGPDEARKKLSQIALEEGWAEAGHNWLWHSRVGGKPTLMIVTSFENYAGMAPPEPSFFEFLTEKMESEEVAALFNEFGAGFSSSDYTVWLHNPDLSDSSDDD
jgi:hypothetical protein